MIQRILFALLTLGLFSALNTVSTQAEEPLPDPSESTEMKYKPKRNYSDALKVGDTAPAFTLKALKGDDTFTLADYKGKKPVVLFFGSYT